MTIRRLPRRLRAFVDCGYAAPCAIGAVSSFGDTIGRGVWAIFAFGGRNGQEEVGSGAYEKSTRAGRGWVGPGVNNRMRFAKSQRNAVADRDDVRGCKHR